MRADTVAGRGQRGRGGALAWRARTRECGVTSPRDEARGGRRHSFAGYYLDDTVGTAAGAVFTFERQGSGWVEGPTLLPNAGNLGSELAAYGDTLMVGTGYTHEVPVYERIAGAWTRTQTLVSPETGYSRPA
ncbi:MAG: hypothetical protein GY711_12875 [bacterium]|nr:hypothetical protein [bacterium]